MIYSRQNQIETLAALNEKLLRERDISRKDALVSLEPEVVRFLGAVPSVATALQGCALQDNYLIKSLIVIGQGPVVFNGVKGLDPQDPSFRALLEDLAELERFYDTIGGIVGYQLMLLRLLANGNPKGNYRSAKFCKPAGVDLSKDCSSNKKAVRWGVEATKSMGEIYPLGGAGDRLNLQDKMSGELLPAAQLSFCGHTLLEGLIRDLQSREHLYYKLYGKALITPVAIMTSWEKNNHQRLIDLCEMHEWFGRPRESFRFFLQPLVPMVTEHGSWVLRGPMQLFLKPGGHGALWKTAMDSGVFTWFKEQERSNVLVRQINNPVANTDNGLLAFIGIGNHEGKRFGFASCSRLIHTPEGMNVLKESKSSEGYEYCITNIEYTDFRKYGIADEPERPGSPYSCYPSNTNILFANLDAVAEALKVKALPGIIANMKHKVTVVGADGSVEEKSAGRLELTMQNIADYIVNRSKEKLAPETPLDTYLTFNERRKTISVVKAAYVPGGPLHGTPEGGFHDLLENNRDLLAHYCGMEVPLAQSEKEYLDAGPNFVALFHPSLGILYSVIAQKVRKGRLAQGSELVVEASEVELFNLDLSGSLIIEAENIMGHRDHKGILSYDGSSSGKCTMLNVRVRNQGCGQSGLKGYWKSAGGREEALRILLHGNAEFHAEDVELTGDMLFDVPEGHRLVVYSHDGETAWHFEAIQSPSWCWEYTFDAEDNIRLEKVKP